MFFFQKSANEPIVDGDDNFFDLEDIAEDVTPAPVKHVQLKSSTNVKMIFQNVNIFSVLFDRQAKLHL
jgi:hypothetical protein